jgi:imidazoleglycerol-phosphate dehydratase
MTLNVNVKASNPHHCAEAVFKALGRALRMAVAIEDRTAAIPSTKGALD